MEFRVAPGTGDVVYRFTLNALLRDDTTAIALAFDTDRDTSTGASALPRDPGAAFPAPTRCSRSPAPARSCRGCRAGAAPVTTAVPMTVDLKANQLTVTVPRSVSDPRGAWRATLAVGLHDPVTGGWKRPALRATADTLAAQGRRRPRPAASSTSGSGSTSR